MSSGSICARCTWRFPSECPGFSLALAAKLDATVASTAPVFSSAWFVFRENGELNLSGGLWIKGESRDGRIRWIEQITAAGKEWVGGWMGRGLGRRAPSRAWNSSSLQVLWMAYNPRVGIPRRILFDCQRAIQSHSLTSSFVTTPYQSPVSAPVSTPTRENHILREVNRSAVVPACVHTAGQPHSQQWQRLATTIDRANRPNGRKTPQKTRHKKVSILHGTAHPSGRAVPREGAQDQRVLQR